MRNFPPTLTPDDNDNDNAVATYCYIIVDVSCNIWYRDELTAFDIQQAAEA